MDIRVFMQNSSTFPLFVALIAVLSYKVRNHVVRLYQKTPKFSTNALHESTKAGRRASEVEIRDFSQRMKRTSA
ncbi:hypothetical protein [Gardnerella vaginalis]|uniref:hypothetical protein n=1 Tax=Gardnerella vaginalis TaxID=2702 RepID=UPI00397089C1